MKTLLSSILVLSAIISVGSWADYKEVTDPELLKKLNVLFEEDISKALNDTVAAYTGEYLCNEVSDKLIWFGGRTIEHDELPNLSKKPALLVSVDEQTKTIQVEGNYFFSITLKIKRSGISGLEAVGRDNVGGQIYSMIFNQQKLRLTRTSMGEVRVLSAKCDVTSKND